MREHRLTTILLTGLAIGLLVSVLSLTWLKAYSGSFLGYFYNAGEKVATKGGKAVNANAKGIFGYRQLMKENENLKEQVESLKKELEKSNQSAADLRRLEELSKALNYEIAGDKDKIVSGNVISMDGSDWLSSFTMDRGSKDGIKVGSVVVAGEGLVGTVESVGRNWAKVATIIDVDRKISFRTEGNQGVLGIASGDKKGRLQGYMIDNKAPIAEGDSVVTSGMGKLPSDIKIGKITKVQYDENKQLLQVTIKPAVDFSSISKVTVIL